MKICPQCQTSYTDDSLQFCLQDGTPLAAASPTTNSWNDSEETLVSPRRDKMRFDLPPQNVTGSSREVVVAEAPKKSNTALIVVLTALITLLTAGAAIMGILYVRRNDKKDAALNINSKPPANIIVPNVAQNSQNNNVNFSVVNKNANQNSDASTPTPTPIPKPILNPNEAKEIKSDVENVVEGWNDALENHDLDAHLNKYAESVDYYKSGGIGIEAIRSDKQRAFEAYDEIKIKISNLQITPDSTGEKATAVFDKKWKFAGEDKFSSGKVQQQLQFAKIGGKWRITGEKDLKVYYVEK